MSDLFDLRRSVINDKDIDATLKEIVNTHKEIN